MTDDGNLFFMEDSRQVINTRDFSAIKEKIVIMITIIIIIFIEIKVKFDITIEVESYR